MKIKQYHIYLADLEPAYGSEPGKIRPVVVVQTDFMNSAHKSAIICPLTTGLIPESKILRVYLSKTEVSLKKDSDILVDQIRAIDNQRFIRKIGKLNPKQIMKLVRNLKIILFE